MFVLSTSDSFYLGPASHEYLQWYERERKQLGAVLRTVESCRTIGFEGVSDFSQIHNQLDGFCPHNGFRKCLHFTIDQF